MLTDLNLADNQLCGVDADGNGAYDASGITALAETLKVNAVMTNINLLKNSMGTAAAAQLSEVLQQHKTLKTLCGITADQTEADFEGHGLQPVDGVLLAADLKVNAVLTNLSVAHNYISGDAAQQLATAALDSKSLTVFSGVPIKELRDEKHAELDLSGKGIGPTEGIVLAELVKVSAALTKLECVSRPKRMPETPETKPETLARNKHGRFLARRSASTGCSHCAPRAAHPSPWTTCAQSSIQPPRRLRQARHQRRREARARALPLSLHRAHSPLWDGAPRTTTATATSA